MARLVRSVGPEWGAVNGGVDGVPTLAAVNRLVVALSRGSRPAAGRPEGLALTLAVVEPAARDNGDGPAPRAGPPCPSRPGWPWARWVDWLQFSLERGRAARSVGCLGHTFVTPPGVGDMKPSGHGQTSSST